MASALVFGVMVSGCNRDNRTAMNQPARGRRGNVNSVRPAEVLSASAYRPPAPAQYAYAQPAHYPVQTSYPAPEVAVNQPQSPAGFVGPVYTAPPTHSQPVQLIVPSAHSRPVVVQPTPELAMARASLPPAVASAPSAVRRPPPAIPRHAPIPELEPMRYRRLPTEQVNSNRRPAEVLISRNSQPNRQEIRQALQPIPQTVVAPSDPSQSWVASPATAMRR